jgi:NAD(P)H-dependent flavin oxidoreductase YrpB (nitropropane dioxygenase family)
LVFLKVRRSSVCDSRIVTLATATSLQEALLIEQQGIDVVVAQGYEAGGTGGSLLRRALTRS